MRADRTALAELKLVTSDMEEALKDAQVIMVVVPSSAHAILRDWHGAVFEGWADHDPQSRPHLRRD